ncbi:malate synthase G [Colwellia sp. 6M3]|jgi:malate synthase|uniref:malate synthase G n=1 Tax=Colwellia sp. 6M3 TaxID=2759849 RepID=UPI0015F4AF19|nr:malate synthase G [Colwellia sp. 6M3]MBA6416122.1 malate synthase G [Colwellia sp. 6M3]|tara:strand:+ start:3275 stop:5458 length:2184 start_codon:yes stop_codon:yes gene_type:complete
MTKFQQKDLLKVNNDLVTFIKEEVLPGLNISEQHFWTALSEITHELGPENRALLVKRDKIQAQIDQWNLKHQGQFDLSAYKTFLTEIGYLVPEGEDFKITTQNVDSEISTQAGPQLVVPTANARFALNAANARWGSLYDALYGTDVISDEGGALRGRSHNSIRANKVIAYGRDFLNEHFPLIKATHHDASAYSINNNKLLVTLNDGTTTQLQNSQQLIGYQGTQSSPSSILLTHHDLRVAIEIDPTSTIGKTDAAGVRDITLESALTTIQDFEDSVVAVDAKEKIKVYRNWLGLMKGDLSETIEKSGQVSKRILKADKVYQNLANESFSVHGRSLLFCRNVGHLMTNPAIVDKDGFEIQEGIMDAMISTLIALHDLQKNNLHRNSRNGNVYIVKPKMHGPEEVAFANKLFNAVEDALSLDRDTIKIGVMDEERRTTVNLKECIRAVKSRVVFINTGFLDRTGDEIHTSMLLGPMVAKGNMKAQPWIKAYEDWNVDIGLACGFTGKAQIGKGMWAIPDEMAAMMKAKIAHPLSGANTAWVPSPTGATLHAMHYHQVDVFAQQKEIEKRPRANIDDILTVPLLSDVSSLTTKDIENELNNNAQGLLGYVVRWVDLGMGASKVPDINNIGLMEDRATLRISSQHICNWLEHNILTPAQVRSSLEKMAMVVDQQNSHDNAYQAMSDDFDNSLSFQAALDLIFKGKTQPNGYTEPLLHEYRKKFIAAQTSRK